MTVSDSPLQVALAGRYRIERELGHGGMATVYLADDVRHHRRVAVKVLGTDLAAALGRDRFLREVQIAATLSHPHILPLYDSGDADGFLFYVMPYVKARSLRVRLDRERQLPMGEALAITRQVAAALDHAHAAGVIHRDIKPENILMHEGEAMVADFGIALATGAGERITESGFVLGTPEYMSPEQAMSEPLDARSDVYSLACVLYEMLAGEPPFTARHARALITKHLVDPVPAVRRLRPDASAAVEQALTRALAKAPADRYGSPGALAAAATTPSLTADAAGGALAPHPAVAVLPFVSLSSDPENEYFADGVTEDVIAHLSKIRAIRVISRTSVMPFKSRQYSLTEIGARLGAATLLDGSVRRAGNRVRIVAQLIDARTDQHLWAETYDREVTDIFVIQTDVALHIAAALAAELSLDERRRIHREPTADLEAYRLYLHGRHWLVKYTAEALRRALEHFRQAVARDPGYALAHAAIAMASIELGEAGVLAPEVAYAEAADAAQRAVSLDPALGDAHCAVAYLKAREFDWTGSEAEFKTALELSPGSADIYDLYGRMCSAMGRFDEALVLQRRAQELDPLAHRLDVATTLLRAGRYQEAAEGAQRALRDDPVLDRAYATLGWARFLSGQVDDGVAALERATSLSPNNTQWLAQLGEAYALAGRRPEAEEVLRRLEDRARVGYVSPYHIAFIHVGLGDHERALDLLESAVEARAGAAYGLKGSFLLAPLRPHPRFVALLRAIHLA